MILLPYASYEASAKVMKAEHIGSAIIAAHLALRQFLEDEESEWDGWALHPCGQMWLGYEPALALYGFIMTQERGRRKGFHGGLHFWFASKIRPETEDPSWLGYEPMHSSHRAALLSSDEPFYSRFMWAEKPELRYTWPEGSRKGIYEDKDCPGGSVRADRGT